MSRAVCALEAKARWAVTGTPIQNKIGDIAALLKFVRAYPYGDAKRFETDIGRMWKAGDIDDAINRLRKLCKGLILRRPKTVIELPPRTDLKISVEFSPQERELYEKLKHQTIARIEEAFRDGDSGGPASNSYISVMQRINALRMICDLGVNYDSRHHLADTEDTTPEVGDWGLVAQETFNLHREVTSMACSICASPCDTATTTFMPGSEPSYQPYFAKCRSYICGDCAQRRVRQRQPVVCPHTSSHSIAPVSLSWTALEEINVPTITGVFGSTGAHRLSSKVAALVAQLKSLPADVKR